MIICVNFMVPEKVAARCWAIVNLFAWIGMGLGSYMGGVLFDISGDYTWSFAFAALMGCGNLIVLIFYFLSGGQLRPISAK